MSCQWFSFSLRSSNDSWSCYRYDLQEFKLYQPIYFLDPCERWKESTLLQGSRYSSLSLGWDDCAISLCTTYQFYLEDALLYWSTFMVPFLRQASVQEHLLQYSKALSQARDLGLFAIYEDIAHLSVPQDTQRSSSSFCSCTFVQRW